MDQKFGTTNNYEKCSRIQNRSISFYLGVHLYNICTTSAQRLRRRPNIVQILYKSFVFAGNRASIVALQGQIGWSLPKYRRYSNMLRLWSRLFTLKKTFTNYRNYKLCNSFFYFEYGLQCPDSSLGNIKNRSIRPISYNNHLG